jgi:hypothetical protein
MSRITRREAAVLVERRERMRRGHKVSLAMVERQMREDMVKELGRMAREYDGTARRAKALLDAILIAEEEGIPAEVLTRARRTACEGLRRSRRAA